MCLVWPVGLEQKGRLWSSLLKDGYFGWKCGMEYKLLFFIFQDSQIRQSTAYSLHQPQGNKEHGTERNGSLYKKSDG